MASRLPLAQDNDEDVEALKAKIRRLEKINEALIDRVERSTDIQGGAYSMFETAITLEAMVRDRTADLEKAMGQLNAVNAALETAHRDADAARVRLRDAIESLNDGFALYDADDRLVMCNRAFLRFFPDLGNAVNEGADFAALAETLARHRRTLGALISPEQWMKDRIALHARAEGAHIQALSDGRWVQINELRTSEGGTVGIYTDITSVKAEDARQRAKELAQRNLALQSTIDTLSEGACLFDDRRRLLAWNGELSNMLKLNQGVQSVISTHDKLAAYCIGERGLDRPQAVEWREGRGPRISTECKMGDRHFVVRSVTLATGGMAFAFDDVTDSYRFQQSLTQTAETLERAVAERTAELVEVNEALVTARDDAEQANRSKTRFIAAASHDLLQPLNAARLFVSALSDQRLSASARRLNDQTSVALDSVEELLEALFEISKLDAGAIAPEIGPVDLERTFSALRIEHAPTAEAKGLDFRVEPSAHWVSSDPRMLRRILQNLVSNAIRYTVHGNVSLKAEADGDTVRICVADTGPGIPEQDRERIFEEFSRLETTSRQPGNGLGLAIVRRYTDRLQHDIQISSEPGRGARFTVTLPSSPPAPQPAGERTAHLMGRPKAEGVALLIDNDASILEGMSELLRGWGLEVVGATDPADPRIEETIRQGTAMLIADYHLDDGQTGADAIRAIRERAGMDLPAVVVTADRSEEVAAELAAMNVPLMTKPVKPAQLRSLLRQLLVLR